MTPSADAPFVSRPGSNVAAGALALGVHAVFVLLLVFGVSWQTQPPAPVMVDLWETLPSPPRTPAPRPAPEPEPEPRPEPAPRPEPVTPPEPAPAPAKPPEPVKSAPKPAEPPPPKAPDIALEKKKKAETERLQKLKAMQEAEARALAEAVRAEAEAVKAAREKQLAEQKKREMLRQMEEEELLQRMANEEADREVRQIEARQARQAAASRQQAEVARAIDRYRSQISAKVRGNTRLPDDIKGNPEVRCLVRLLPTGEVTSVRVTQSSGDAAYDAAVVRAIEKSSPLPLPDDHAARAAFVPELSLVHRPQE